MKQPRKKPTPKLLVKKRQEVIPEEDESEDDAEDYEKNPEYFIPYSIEAVVRRQKEILEQASLNNAQEREAIVKELKNKYKTKYKTKYKAPKANAAAAPPVPQ